MRIIAGEFRGRKLLSPEGDITRPITDRVKQSLFDILTPLLPDAVVYDLFCGTGSLGLESLSRGAAHATFFESDRSALSLLKQNIAALKIQDSCTIIPTDIFQHFSTIKNQKLKTKNPSIIFLDPPYRFLRERQDDLLALSASIASLIPPTATVVFRHDAADVLPLPSLPAYDTRTYGGMTIELLRRT